MLVFPNAKINIGLNVLSKREDGFHDIETLFVPIKKLSDSLEIIPSRENTFHCTGLNHNLLEEDNICLKAYQLIKEEYGISPVAIHLHKNIPTGAGLGGGSSDGAFTLILLNKIFNLKITDQKLEEYASMLGSDCALFVKNTTAIGTERGNVLKQVSIKSLEDKFIHIIKPNFSMNTGLAYQNIQPAIPEKMLEEKLKSPIQNWKNYIVNDFETNVFQLFPELKEIKEDLYKRGALYVSMSGSGTTIYGIFDFLPTPLSQTKDYFQWIGKIE